MVSGALDYQIKGAATAGVAPGIDPGAAAVGDAGRLFLGAASTALRAGPCWGVGTGCRVAYRPSVNVQTGCVSKIKTALFGAERWLSALLSALLLALSALLGLAQPAAAATPTAVNVMLEELTSTELKARIDAGTTTVLVPIGGTEQNGPHMALGKHNLRVKLLAARIAERLGLAVVAPVIAYVPEGAIDPATQHMRWVGTISIPEAAFEAVLEGAARSLCQHGLREVVLLADHGGYLKNTERVAARLNRAFAAGSAGHSACRVLALAEYYQVTQSDYVEALKARGFGLDEIGRHAGLADTSLMLAIDPTMVRMDSAAARQPGGNDGVTGDPRRASAELGRLGMARIIEVSVAAIGAQRRLRSPAASGGATITRAKH